MARGIFLKRKGFFSLMEQIVVQKGANQLFELLFQKDEISWQSIIYDLVKTEEMDPWDVDVSLLANKYIETIKQLKQFDFHISGKMLLAAAILLNIKSTQLLGKDMNAFDTLLHPNEEAVLDGEDCVEPVEIRSLPLDKMTLLPRTPQPRMRKVSIFDLVEALQKALEVKRRRILRDVDVPEVILPEKKVDIDKLIDELLHKIKGLFVKDKKLKFQELLISDRKEDKIYTFIPLLHLSHQRKIDLEQEAHFGDITITVK